MLGEGTTVRVLLPCTTRQPLAALPATVSSLVADAAALKILLVDDDDSVRTIVAGALENHGHHVVEANDGANALAILADQAFDIAIIDFAMPGMNGAELADRIAKQWPTVPVMFASGFADTDAIDSVMGRNAVMLRKPFRIDEMLAAIDRLLTSRSLDSVA